VLKYVVAFEMNVRKRKDTLLNCMVLCFRYIIKKSSGPWQVLKFG